MSLLTAGSACESEWSAPATSPGGAADQRRFAPPGREDAGRSTWVPNDFFSS